MEKKRVAISQSNYIPWKGYFDFINCVDQFILYDTVQYTRRDWRNRNKIKTKDGLKWLTIPVSADFHDPINRVKVADPEWRVKHWDLICGSYRNAKFFESHSDKLHQIYESAEFEMLSDINRHFLMGLMEILKIDTRLSSSSDFNAEGGKSERLVNLCKQVGAGVYVSGEAARNYLDTDLFKSEGIDVEWMDYSGYQPYEQLHGEFIHQVSVIDLILNTGDRARDYLIS